MRIEKRIVDGREVEVHIEEYTGEHKDMEKYERNMEHADRIAASLAKNKEFINALAHAIVASQPSGWDAK